MTDKEFFLDWWGFTPGTPEAEEAWRAKVEMMERPQRGPMGFVSRDVCYDSPIDGRPITNKHARIEDMARANCIEYDPGMKQDHQRRLAEQESILERSVDTTIEREISTMPSRKREKLQAELEGGLAPAIERRTHA